ncbi:MAG TPA: methyltransferase [Marmoricola sp.]|nr:methyltransferase [Marmoricola sp.]
MTSPEELVEWRAPLLVQAVNAVGLGDLLAQRPLTATEIGERTGWRPDLATRVLRALVPRGLFRCDDQGRWHLTDVGQVLRSDHPASVAGARLSGFEVGGWTRMLQTLRSGQPSFELTFDTTFWDWLAEHPDDRSAFDQKMRGRLHLALELVDEYPWPGTGRLVDVGGGTGTLLTRVLALRPGLAGVLFDVPETIATAEAVVRASGTADRCDLVAGSFFEAVPKGGDIYLLSQILHDWPDEDAVRILTRVHEAMEPGGRLLLLEGVVPDDPADTSLGLLDVHMLAMFGSGERDRQQWKTLLDRAGFRLDDVVPGPYVSWVEASPRAGAA